MKLTFSSLFRSLRVKFGLLVLILLFLTFLFSSAVLIYRSIVIQRDDLISQARAYARLSARPIGSAYNLYYNSGHLKFRELIVETLRLNTDIKKVQIISATGEILFDSEELAKADKPEYARRENNPEILENVRLNITSEIPTKANLTEPDQIIEPYFEDFGAHPFSIRYFISYDSISKNIATTVSAILILSAIFLTISIILIVFVVNRTIINPIEVVISGARKISSGNLSHTIKVNTRDEVEDLANAVNTMAKTLRQNIEDLKKLDELKDEFVIIASHNLRTPVTVLKGYLSTARTSGVRFEGQEAVEVKISELEKLIEELVSIVSIEAKKEYLVARNVDLLELLKEVWLEFDKKAQDKNIVCLWKIPKNQNFILKTDQAKMKKVFQNILDNAIKFNRQNGKVTIGIEAKKDKFVVSIADTGIGISPEYSQKIYEKFHRGTPILEYEYPGTGLGLYIAKLIVDYLKGSIWFKSKQAVGTTFFVSLPKLFREF